MQALMKALMAAGAKGKSLANEAGNVMKGGKDIAMGGGAAMTQGGGRAEALKKLMMANKGGAAALGGAGALGAGGAGYGLAEAMEGDDEDGMSLMKKLGLA